MKKRFVALGLFLLLPYLAACSWMSAIPTPAPTPVTESQPQPESAHPTVLLPGSAIRFETLNIDEGLSQSVVNDLVQDQQGFLWLGTQDGLNRYDGISFKVYKPTSGDPASLSDGWITALYVDRAGSLWVGTNQGGLNRYDALTGKFVHYQNSAQDPASILPGAVRAIVQDRQGALWIGTEHGLNRFDATTGAFTHYQNDPKNDASLSQDVVVSLFSDSKGNLWAGTLGGLNLYEPEEDTFRRYLRNRDDPESISYDSISSIAEDRQGNLWVGTDKGLNRLDIASGKFVHYLFDEENPFSLSNDNTSDLLVDNSGTLWVGTDNGLNRYDEKVDGFFHYRHNSVVPASLSSNTVTSLYEDMGGVLWIGTWGGGANKFNLEGAKFALYRYDPDQPQGLSGAAIFSVFAEKSGDVWIGTFSDGLSHFESSTGRVESVFRNNPDDPGSLSSSYVWSVFRDSHGILWVGTSNGLDAYDEQRKVFIHHVKDENDPDSLSSNVVYKIYEDQHGELWLGTRMGLDRYDRLSGKFIHYSVKSSQDISPYNISDIVHDRRTDILWITTLDNGFYRFDSNTKVFEKFLHDPQNPNSLANNIVMGVYQDEKGILWISTGGGGLSRFDPETSKFTNYTDAQGLANNFVYCAMPDAQGNLWLSTNYGISKFSPTTETFQNYTVADGLQSNEFNQGACALGPDGSIYFAGGFGLNRFYPAEVSAENFPPPVELIALTRDGEPVETRYTVEKTDEITLNWPQNSFEFEFVALSFADSRKNQYAYRLENFDSGWNSLGTKHYGRYTNLPGGEYTLRLKAASGDGVWNETGRTIKVKVIPPFWQTWWFYVLTGFAGVGIVWAGYRVRLNSIVTHRQELERQVSERTREIERLFEQTKELAVIEERNRLARELHDSAKQKAFAALAQLGTASGLIQHNAKAAQTHITEAENLVYDVIQELTFLIQEMYPLALKEKGLVTYLREYVFEWENRTGIRVNLLAENEKRLPLNIEQAIYRIAQEALANVARHSHASRVELNVIFGPEDVKLLAEDDGCGFDVSQKPKGIGLRSMQERAESMGGCVIVSSAAGKGTRVQATVPVKGNLGD